MIKSQLGSKHYIHLVDGTRSFIYYSLKKVSLLVHDAILIEIWREQILPHLLKQTKSKLSPLMVYTVVINAIMF